MPNRNYERGRRNEYKSANELRKRGYTVMRMAGSKGPFDLVAVRPERILFVQVKTNDGLSAEEKAKIAAVKTPSNAHKILHIWRDGGDLIERQLP